MLKAYHSQKIKIINQSDFKNVFEITATSVSLPDKSLIAFGLKDGTVSVWNPFTQSLEFNTEKHTLSVT